MASAPEAGPARPETFRFQPGRPMVAAAAALFGAGLFATSIAAGEFAGRGLSLGIGAGAVVLALLYLGSPAWRTEVVASDAGLEVLNRGDRRFLLPWTDVVRVVAAPARAAAFVDGGTPERSLLLPGPGVRAPYRIADQRRLYELICARVPPARITQVERLDRPAPSPPPA